LDEQYLVGNEDDLKSLVGSRSTILFQKEFHEPKVEIIVSSNDLWRAVQKRQPQTINRKSVEAKAKEAGYKCLCLSF
jgi:hypothetical protein